MKMERLNECRFYGPLALLVKADQIKVERSDGPREKESASPAAAAAHPDPATASIQDQLTMLNQKMDRLEQIVNETHRLVRQQQNIRGQYVAPPRPPQCSQDPSKMSPALPGLSGVDQQ